MALGLRDVQKKNAKKLPKTAAGRAKMERKSPSAKSAEPKRRKKAAGPWESVGSAPLGAGADVHTNATVGQHTAGAKSRTDKTRAKTKKDKDQFQPRSSGMKEQGMQFLKMAIATVLDQKDQIVQSTTFQNFYGTSKEQLQERLAQYPWLKGELNARIEKLRLCEKAEMVEAMLREFAKGEIRVEPESTSTSQPA